MVDFESVFTIYIRAWQPSWSCDLQNDVDLQYSQTFINSISRLHLPDFRSQAEIVSEKSTVFTLATCWEIAAHSDVLFRNHWEDSDETLYEATET